MSRLRDKPDGLPYRLYQRRGVRTYSIGYKAVDGKWTFRLRCPVTDTKKIAELRRDAIDRANRIGAGAPSDNTVAALIDAWFKRQEALPPGTVGKRAASTIAENLRESKNLKLAMGHILVVELEMADAYEYLDACQLAKDKEGNPRPRPAKGNKEIALMRTILELGVRLRAIKTNPFAEFERLPTAKNDRLVKDHELALAIEVGRRLDPQQHIVAMALKAAWLCVRRSVEVRAMTRAQIGDDGISWKSGKVAVGQIAKEGLIEWSPELRACVDEALSIKRHKLAGSWYVFGNLSGHKYTKGGWKKTLSVLMRECIVEAEKRGISFEPFSLQDCRPMGVSSKLERGDTDTVDATLHSNEKMIRQVYDRRQVRRAKPAG